MLLKSLLILETEGDELDLFLFVLLDVEAKLGQF